MGLPSDASLGGVGERLLTERQFFDIRQSSKRIPYCLPAFLSDITVVPYKTGFMSRVIERVTMPEPGRVRERCSG
jgi:hypothetical protein